MLFWHLRIGGERAFRDYEILTDLRFWRISRRNESLAGTLTLTHFDRVRWDNKTIKVKFKTNKLIEIEIEIRINAMQW